VKNAENMGFLTISDPVGRSEGSFPPADFKIVNEIKGLEHISYGMAVKKIKERVERWRALAAQPMSKSAEKLAQNSPQQ